MVAPVAARVHPPGVEFSFSDREGLRRELERHEFAKEAYSLYGGHPPDAHCLDYREGRWWVYYSVDGRELAAASFEDEPSACLELLDRLVRDPHTRPEARPHWFAS